MLLSTSYDIEKTLVNKFVWDDGTSKETKLEVGDVATFVWNNRGQRDEITGKLVRIEAERHFQARPHEHCQPGMIDSCDKNGWFILVDGSMSNQSNMKRIVIRDLLNIEVIKRENFNTTVSSPLGDNNITDFRLVGNILQLSVNHGKTWMKVCTLPKFDFEVEEGLEEVAENIGNAIPEHINPADRNQILVSVLKAMEASGQITINKTYNCECGKVPETPSCSCGGNCSCGGTKPEPVEPSEPEVEE